MKQEPELKATELTPRQHAEAELSRLTAERAEFQARATETATRLASLRKQKLQALVALTLANKDGGKDSTVKQLTADIDQAVGRAEALAALLAQHDADIEAGELQLRDAQRAEANERNKVAIEAARADAEVAVTEVTTAFRGLALAWGRFSLAAYRLSQLSRPLAVELGRRMTGEKLTEALIAGGCRAVALGDVPVADGCVVASMVECPARFIEREQVSFSAETIVAELAKPQPDAAPQTS